MAPPPAANTAFADRRELLSVLDDATVPVRLLAAATDHGDSPALTDGWTLSWSEFRTAALTLAQGFVDLGVGPGDTVAMMLGNRAEHLLADQGVTHAGGVPLTVYRTLAPEQVAFIVRDSGARILVLEGAEEVARFAEAEFDYAVVLDETAVPAGDSRFLSWSDLVRRSVRADLAAEVEGRWQALRYDDTVTLLYTSGTTADPKGVRLTHENVLYEAAAIQKLAGYEQPVNVSFLPLAHIAEREISVYIPIHTAGHVVCCTDPLKLADTLRETRPTTFFAVPRVWEKLVSGLQAYLTTLPLDQQAGISQATAIGQAYVEACQAAALPTPELQAQFDFVDEHALSALRGAIGLDRAQWISSGAAPLAPSVISFLASLGVVMAEVYGMTETAGAVTANTRDGYRIGSVGRALPGVELQIAEDGEVLVRGPVTTPGYHQRPEQTGELLSDGWLHTGDIGRLTDDGYLYIVDRKKELLITSGGENVAPALVEGVLKESPLIGQAMAVGDQQKFIAALLVLDAEALPGWLSSQGLPSMTVREAAVEPRILAAVGAAVDTANERLARVQQVKTWKLLSSEWTPETGELTPTMKLKRRVILKQYAAEIEGLYS